MNFTQMKQVQEAELKASANEREVQLLRISLRQQKEKVKQLHELLILREQEHRYGVFYFSFHKIQILVLQMCII